jgi:hypothetical protein
MNKPEFYIFIVYCIYRKFLSKNQMFAHVDNSFGRRKKTHYNSNLIKDLIANSP